MRRKILLYLFFFIPPYNAHANLRFYCEFEDSRGIAPINASTARSPDGISLRTDHFACPFIQCVSFCRCNMHSLTTALRPVELYAVQCIFPYGYQLGAVCRLSSLCNRIWAERLVSERRCNIVRFKFHRIVSVFLLLS